MQFAGPAAFFEPSGIEFKEPGVQLSMVLSAGSSVAAGQQLSVFRLTAEGGWESISSTVTDAGVVGNTLRVSFNQPSCPFHVMHSSAKTFTAACIMILCLN